MDVKTGLKLWGYSKRPKNWKKIMYKEIGQCLESEALLDEKPPKIDEKPKIDEIPEVEEKPKIDEKPQIDESLESEASIEKPKITARVSNPTSLTLHDPDSSFSYM